jgi:hypothetical protein
VGVLAGGVAAHVNITVNLETLLGLVDDPAEMDGHGPITPQLARALAFAEGSTWRRLVTDPIHGHLLDYGRTTYTPPAPLKDHIRARDVTCRTPNCTQPATHCDQDHLIPWPAGTTSEDNLCAECRWHHRLKHEGRWIHRLSDNPNHPPGTILIISPTGHTYLSHRPKIGRVEGDRVTAPGNQHRPTSEEAQPAATGPELGPPPF